MKSNNHYFRCMICLRRTGSNDPDFVSLVRELDEELWQRYDTIQAVYDGFNKLDGIDTVVIAYDNNQPVGCACFKPHGKDSVEIKRMYVKPSARSKGIAGSILTELERWAAKTGYRSSVLETGTRQPEAVRLYTRLGYKLTDNFEPYVGMDESICFSKQIK